MTSCVYAGAVVHRRAAPVPHRFRYGVGFFYLDLDELPRLHRRLRLFGVNAPNLISFHDADHVDARPVATKAKILACLGAEGIDLTGGKVFLLTQCRIFHYLFNPVSFHFCHAADGALRAVVAEVNNTFGARHLYLLTDTNRLPAAPGRARYRAAKELHVSPFVSMDAAYEFHFRPATDRLAIAIRAREHGGAILDATLTGTRRPLTDRTLAWLLVRYPLLTLKITGAIHWEALRLALKGVPFHRQPPPAAAQLAQQRRRRTLAAPH